MITGTRGATRPWLILERPMTMGQRIRYWRIIHGQTQTRLAVEASQAAGITDGLSKSFISLLEADRTQPSVATLHGIAHALSVTIDYLVTGTTGLRRQTPRVNIRPLMHIARARRENRIRHTPKKEVILT